MARIKVLIPKEHTAYLKSIAGTEVFNGNTRCTVDMVMYENENGQLYIDQCDGNCGMNYCDENGCIERKRHLTELTPQKS